MNFTKILNLKKRVSHIVERLSSRMFKKLKAIHYLIINDRSQNFRKPKIFKEPFLLSKELHHRSTPVLQPKQKTFFDFTVPLILPGTRF